MMIIFDIKISNIFEHNSKPSYKGIGGAPFYFEWQMIDWIQLDIGGLKLENVSPVQITNKVLLACGFVYNTSYYWKVYGKNGVFIVKYDYTYDMFMVQIGKGFSLGVKHLHDLQNIYYEVTAKNILHIDLEMLK